ncbi:hypothetical protein [Streptomyces sp. NPDC048411]
MTTMYAAPLRGIQVRGHRIHRPALIKGSTATTPNRNIVAELVEMTRA